MKKFATGKDEAIVRIPDIAGLVIVGVQPALAALVAFHAEHVAIAIRVDFARNAAHDTILRIPLEFIISNGMNTLGIEFYSASQMPWRLAPSIFIFYCDPFYFTQGHPELIEG